MKIAIYSDTHSKQKEIELPSADMLIFCGDMSFTGDISDIENFAIHMEQTNCRYKIAIAGNHDFCFEDKRKKEAESILKNHGITYLNDSGINIEGINIWGSPVQPEFMDWAFNRKRGEDIQKHWNLIPEKTDVLITHGPPAGILDVTMANVHAGCENLLETINKIRPRLHCFGHIHESAGIIDRNKTIFANASVLDGRYKYKNPVTTLDL